MSASGRARAGVERAGAGLSALWEQAVRAGFGPGAAWVCWAAGKREGKGARAGLLTGPNGEKGERVGLSRFHGLDWAGFGLVSGFYFLVFFLLSFSETNSNLMEFK